MTAVEYLMKAEELSDNEIYEEALFYYTKAVELDPNDPYTRASRGLCYERLEQYTDAIDDFF